MSDTPRTDAFRATPIHLSYGDVEALGAGLAKCFRSWREHAEGLERDLIKQGSPPVSDVPWSPMLRTSDLQFSLYADGTFEIRDGGEVYAHLTAEETAAMLKWIDARETP